MGVHVCWYKWVGVQVRGQPQMLLLKCQPTYFETVFLIGLENYDFKSRSELAFLG